MYKLDTQSSVSVAYCPRLAYHDGTLYILISKEAFEGVLLEFLTIQTGVPRR